MNNSLKLKKAEDFWRNHLMGYSEPTRITIGTNACFKEGNNKKTVCEHRLSLDITNSIQDFSKKHGISLLTILRGAWSNLLCCYSQQEDVVFGIKTSGSSSANLLPLRIHLRPNDSVLDLLSTLEKTANDIKTHSYVSLKKILEWTGIKKETLSFESIVISEDENIKEVGPPLVISGVFDKTTQFKINYESDLFDGVAIKKMAQHLELMISEIINNPQLALNSLNFLTEGERELLEAWNRTEKDYPLEKSIDQLFEEQVDRYPNVIALVYKDKQLSYTLLNMRANQLAHFLLSKGIGSKAYVGISCEISLDLMVGLLAILKTGAAYVPIDPDYPKSRIEYICSNIQAPMILTNTKLEEKFVDYPGTLFRLDLDWRMAEKESYENPTCLREIDSLAYVIYTSGSTGQPKGVMINHRSLINAYYAWYDTYNLFNVNCHLQTTSMAFDLFTGIYSRALCSGKTLVLCPKETLLTPDQLYQLITDKKIDFAEFVPTLLRPLILYLETHHLKLKNMKMLICGSDQWSLNEYRRFKKVLPPSCRLLNSYGITEATIDSTYYEQKINHEQTREFEYSNSVPIGHPFPNTKTHIFSLLGQPCPINVPGELYIEGAGLAKGYLNKSQMSREKFISTVDRKGHAHRYYKTGDLVYYLSDGNINFLGRIDQQIKLHGYRIELEEIRMLLLKHHDVGDAIVRIHQCDSDSKYLLAYIVINQAKTVPESTALLICKLKDYLSEQLPQYMLPSKYVTLDGLPLMVNGKIDYNALPHPEREQYKNRSLYVAPQTEIERALYSVYSQILKINYFGIECNFFELGGNSLQASLVLSEIHKTYHIEISLHFIFHQSSIKELVHEIQRQLCIEVK